MTSRAMTIAPFSSAGEGRTDRPPDLPENNIYVGRT